MKEWNIQSKPAFVISVAALILAAISLYGTCRAGGFETSEYRTNLRTELIPIIPSHEGAEEDGVNYVALTISNLHRYDNAVINDIGGVIDETGDCWYSTKMFKIIPEETEFPIVLRPGHIAGGNQLGLVLQISQSLTFPETRYRDTVTNSYGSRRHITHVCFKTADEEPVRYPIVGPAIPLPGPAEVFRESRKGNQRTQ